MSDEEYPVELINSFVKLMEYECRLGLIGEEEKKQNIKNFIIEFDIHWNRYLRKNK